MGRYALHAFLRILNYSVYKRLECYFCRSVPVCHHICIKIEKCQIIKHIACSNSTVKPVILPYKIVFDESITAICECFSTQRYIVEPFFILSVGSAAERMEIYLFVDQTYSNCFVFGPGINFRWTCAFRISWCTIFIATSAHLIVDIRMILLMYSTISSTLQIYIILFSTIIITTINRFIKEFLLIFRSIEKSLLTFLHWIAP